MSRPDTITITERLGADQTSTGADVFVKIARTGVMREHPAAVEQARVRLVETGLSAASISTHSVTYDTIGGGWVLFTGVLAAVAWFWLSRGLGTAVAIVAIAGGLAAAPYMLERFKWFGTSTFVLKVHCADAASVGRVLDLTASSPGLDLDHIEWRYDIAPTDRAALVDECIRRANDRAHRVAHRLGVKVLGVHAYHEVHDDPQGTQPYAAQVYAQRRSLAPPGSMSRSHGPLAASEQRRTTVAVEYRIGGYQPDGAALSEEPPR